MDAIELLLTRSSQPNLKPPAPQGEALETIMQAALRAPDHANLTPWRFIVCQGEGLNRLGKLFSEAAEVTPGMSDRDRQRAAQLPLRAPMVIVAVSRYQEHEKVPWVEQVASASCAVHAMQMAALAQGFAGIWRTGSYAHNHHVRQQLELGEKDEIIGFLYLGSSPVSVPPKPQRDVAQYFEFWDA